MITRKAQLIYAPIKLTMNDRCDGCGAQAKHMYYIKHKGVLMFCNHCNNKNNEALSIHKKVITTVEGWDE